jgi:regulator of PEP synthase PpsR (kinase-PPPase family)
VKQLHLHLLSDSTGETLDIVAKACLAQFDNVDAIRHFWPMVRSEGHLERVLDDIAQRPGLVLYTLVNPTIRRALEQNIRRRGIHAVSVLDPVIDALSAVTGEATKAGPGAARARRCLFRRGWTRSSSPSRMTTGSRRTNGRGGHRAAGVSRTSKTPTSIYLVQSVGYKVANVPLVPRIAAPATLFRSEPPAGGRPHHQSERLIQIRRNRLLALNQAPETEYVDVDAVRRDLSFARRIFADQGWPVIDVTRRSIEENRAGDREIVR